MWLIGTTALEDCAIFSFKQILVVEETSYLCTRLQGVAFWRTGVFIFTAAKTSVS
jgi:hypothetical protein